MLGAPASRKSELFCRNGVILFVCVNEPAEYYEIVHLMGMKRIWLFLFAKVTRREMDNKHAHAV